MGARVYRAPELRQLQSLVCACHTLPLGPAVGLWFFFCHLPPTSPPPTARAFYPPAELRFFFNTMSEGKKKERSGKRRGKKERDRKSPIANTGAPTLKPMRNPVLVEEGRRLTMKCEASGSPPLSYKWYKDGTVLKKSKEVKIKGSKKNSKIQIASARLEDSGNYMCVVENEGGSNNSTSTVHVQSITTTLPPGSGHARRCNDTEKGYCVNDGECYFIHGINQLSCKCPRGYFGPRCLQPEPLRLHMPKPNESMSTQRTGVPPSPPPPSLSWAWPGSGPAQDPPSRRRRGADGGTPPVSVVLLLF